MMLPRSSGEKLADWWKAGRSGVSKKIQSVVNTIIVQFFIWRNQFFCGSLRKSDSTCVFIPAAQRHGLLKGRVVSFLGRFGPQNPHQPNQPPPTTPTTPTWNKPVLCFGLGKIYYYKRPLDSYACPNQSKKNQRKIQIPKIFKTGKNFQEIIFF